MKEFDITVEFGDCEQAREIYTVITDTKEDAIQTAKEMALDDISIVEVEDVTDLYAKPHKQNSAKFRRYLLIQTDIHGEDFVLLESKNDSWLIKIAESISLPDVTKVEVVGTNDLENRFKTWRTIFTREF